MKRLLLMLPVLLAAGEALAIDRYDISQMSCQQVQTLLQTERKAVLRYPSSRIPGMMRYEKYVGDRMSCGIGNVAIRARVPTEDNKKCPVFRCTAMNRSVVR